MGLGIVEDKASRLWSVACRPLPRAPGTAWRALKERLHLHTSSRHVFDVWHPEGTETRWGRAPGRRGSGGEQHRSRRWSLGVTFSIPSSPC